MASQGIVTLPDGRWVMHAGARSKTHNETHYGDLMRHKFSGLWRASIREDGIMALKAESRGECWSSPLEYEGSELTINAWTRFGGTVRIGLCEEDGTLIPGRSLEDCDRMTGDLMWSTVSWKGQSDISQWERSTVRLHIELTRGWLHAWRIGDA